MAHTHTYTPCVVWLNSFRYEIKLMLALSWRFSFLNTFCLRFPSPSVTSVSSVQLDRWFLYRTVFIVRHFCNDRNQFGDRTGKYCEYCRWEMNLRCEQQQQQQRFNRTTKMCSLGELSVVNSRCMVHRSATVAAINIHIHTENIIKDTKRTINLQWRMLYTDTANQTHKSSSWIHLFILFTQWKCAGRTKVNKR